MTTHDLEEAERIADRIVIIDRGQVVASGTPAELMRSSTNDEIRFGAPPQLDTAGLGRSLNAFVDEIAPGEYQVAMPPTPANVAALTAWLAEHELPLADLRAGRQRLEDVFLRLTAVTGEHPSDHGRARPPRATPAAGRGPGERAARADPCRTRSHAPAR